MPQQPHRITIKCQRVLSCDIPGKGGKTKHSTDCCDRVSVPFRHGKVTPLGQTWVTLYFYHSYGDNVICCFMKDCLHATLDVSQSVAESFRQCRTATKPNACNRGSRVRNINECQSALCHVCACACACDSGSVCV
jgi:hypothetical protein